MKIKLQLFVAIMFFCIGKSMAQSNLTTLPGYGRVYTTTADFNEGSLLSVNTSIPDQLQLDQPGRPLPYVNIACSNRGTVVRINIETGAIVGEYLTAPGNMKKNPSRTTVDKYGNIWVTNRDEDGISGGVSKGSVTKIGVTIGGTRCDAAGVPDSNGQYLKPPFFYNTCVDRNNDGLIKTSKGLANILEWNNSNGANTNGGVSNADDEAIITYTRVFAVGARTVAVDDRNNLWVGGLSNRFHEKLNGNTGAPVAGTQFNVGKGGYGGFIADNGSLWSASLDNELLKYTPNNLNPANSTVESFGGVGNYGLGVDPLTGEVWHASSDGNAIFKLSPSGVKLGQYQHGYQYAQGCAVDAAGNVWVAHALFPFPSTSVGHLRTDGTFIGNVNLPNGGAGPTGVAVDANGKVWVSCYNSSQAMRIDPNAGPIVNGHPLGAVDLVVDLGAGANPYNYSDMTGYVVINATVPSGTWNTIHDGGVAGIKWGEMNWTDSIPEGTGVRVEARASDNLLTLAEYPFVEVQKGVSFCCDGVTGRYVEIRVTLFRQQSVNISPILYDLSIQSCDIYPNIPPVISSTRGCNGDTLKVAAGQSISFTINSSDADQNQQVTLTSSSLPFGATMNQTLPVVGNPVQSVFTWPTEQSQIGVYNFSFTTNDLYCYSATCPVVVNVVPCPTIQCSGIGISCVGDSNGRASVVISGNPDNFTYTWNTNPPQNTQSISNLPPGSYQVVTDDGFACKDSCTVVIPAEPCAGFRTFTQGGWGATPKGNNPATYLKQKFTSTFPAGLEIGCNNKLRLTSWQAIVDFLPSGSTARALPAGTLINPGARYSNVLAGQLVAATLSVAFDSADANFSPSSIRLSDLVIASGVFSGWRVSALIAEANKKIGGCSSIYSFTDLNNALDRFNRNYDNTLMTAPTVNNCYLSCPLQSSGGTLRSTESKSFTEIMENESEFEIYPNPTKISTTIRYTAKSSGNVNIDILNVNGVKIKNVTRKNMVFGETQTMTISTTDLNAGTYFIRVLDDNKVSLKKLVIIK
jgi:streptogramin lyase